MKIRNRRVIAYVDGFNLFYGIRAASKTSDIFHMTHGGQLGDCLGRSLYWLDLQGLILSRLKTGDDCVAIKYFSAPRRVPSRVVVPDPERYVSSNRRQSIYLDVLRQQPLIQVILGWYSENNPNRCNECGHEWPNFEEKVTDVNMATAMICDAYEDRFDRAMIVSADADLVPPIKAVLDIGKEAVVELPPGRKRAKHLRSVATGAENIKIRSVRPHRLPDTISRDALPDLNCPDRWKHSDEWVWHDPCPVPGLSK